MHSLYEFWFLPFSKKVRTTELSEKLGYIGSLKKAVVKYFTSHFQQLDDFVISYFYALEVMFTAVKRKKNKVTSGFSEP